MSLSSQLPLPSGPGSQAASHPLIMNRDTKQFISSLQEPAKNRPTGCSSFRRRRLVKLQAPSPRRLISLAGMGPGSRQCSSNCYQGTFKNKRVFFKNREVSPKSKSSILGIQATSRSSFFSLEAEGQGQAF